MVQPVAPLIAPSPKSASASFDVLTFGAVGDGNADDTQAINRAFDAAVEQGGGVVRFRPGTYRCGTLRLRSHVHVRLNAGARIVGTTELDAYTHFVRPEPNPENQSDRWHRALILGQDVEDIVISGEGAIDGDDVFDAHGEARMRGPHTILLGGCRGVRIEGVSLLNSANYAVLVEYCDDLEFRDLRFRGGWDGIHVRGMPDRPCRRIQVLGCDFQTGDDAIAGRYWDEFIVKDCLINASCNGIRVIGPATRLTIDGNLFYGPGRFPHRAQDRLNMLAGIILQPGAWDTAPGALDHVVITNNTMTEVKAALAISTTPASPVGRIEVHRLTASRVYGAAVTIEGLPEQRLSRVDLQEVTVQYTSEAVRTESVSPTAVGKGVRDVAAWGLYANFVDRLSMQRVRMEIDGADLREELIAQNVGRLDRDDVVFEQIDTAKS